jgi:enoyl-CoA hydratase
MVDLRMDGPGKNSLGVAMMDSIIQRLREAGGKPVLVIGAGDVFSAGLNLKEVAKLDVPGMQAFLRKLEAMVEALYTYPGPTVACINGHAIAGGCIVALCCDYRVARDDADIRIGLNEVALGLRFPPLILRMVRQQLSPEHQSEVLLGAGLHAPREALRLGLVDAVAQDAEKAAREKLAALAAHPAQAYAYTKEDLRGATLSRPEDEALFQRMLPVWTSPEIKQRIEAVLKRPGR